MAARAWRLPTIVQNATTTVWVASTLVAADIYRSLVPVALQWRGVGPLLDARFVQTSLSSPSLQSIRGRLFVLIGALAVPALAIVSILSWGAYRSQRDAVRSELSNTAKAVAGLVDTEMDRSLAILRTLLAVRSLREGDWDNFDATARRVLPDQKRWLVVVDMHGRQMINTRLPRGAPLPNIALDPVYVAAMRRGEEFVSDVRFGPAAQELVVHIGIPFQHENGQLLGISIVMTPDSLGEILDVQRFAPEGVLAIVDREGKIVTRNPYQKAYIGRPAMPDMVRAAKTGVETVLDSVTLDGIPVLTVVTPTNNGWSVLLGISKAKLFANTRPLFFFGLASALLVTIAALVIAIWIARMVVRGVDALAQDAERLARGEPPAVRTGHLHEINVIAAAMLQLAKTRSVAEAELREARDRLHDYAQELERKVDERTASLRDAVTQMEEFSYTVSHDLRGPLRSMNGYATALLEDHGPSLDPEAREYLRRIVRASERMNQLTAELLSYSRIARADLIREPLALEPIFRGILDHYGELGPAVADVTLVTPMGHVLGHESSLTQAFANLLTNAAKFVKPGERPQITVRTERRGPHVRVWVEDKGIGIDPLHQARLFRIFERAPEAKGYSGTGVGLAIVRKIVEKSGGQCGVESDGRSGSRFWVELDAAPSGEASE